MVAIKDLIKTNTGSLQKDKKTQAIINTDKGQLATIVAQRQRGKQITSLATKVEQLEQRLSLLEQQIKN